MPRLASSINPQRLAAAVAADERKQARGLSVGIDSDLIKASLRLPLVPPTPTPELVCILSARIPLEPVSVNELYANVPNVGRVLTSKGKKFKAEMAKALLTAQVRPPFRERRMALVLTLSGTWENKDGTPKKKDATNFVKAIEDALSDFMGVDDKWFYEAHVLKKHAAEPLIEVQVFVLEEK